MNLLKRKRAKWESSAQAAYPQVRRFCSKSLFSWKKDVLYSVDKKCWYWSDSLTIHIDRRQSRTKLLERKHFAYLKIIILMNPLTLFFLFILRNRINVDKWVYHHEKGQPHRLSSRLCLPNKMKICLKQTFWSYILVLKVFERSLKVVWRLGILIEPTPHWIVMTVVYYQKFICILLIDYVIVGPWGYKHGFYIFTTITLNKDTTLECRKVGSWTVTS